MWVGETEQKLCAYAEIAHTKWNRIRSLGLLLMIILFIGFDKKKYSLLNPAAPTHAGNTLIIYN